MNVLHVVPVGVASADDLITVWHDLRDFEEALENAMDVAKTSGFMTYIHRGASGWNVLRSPRRVGRRVIILISKNFGLEYLW